MSATISIFPKTKPEMLHKLLAHAQSLKDSDPQQAIQLHEEVVRSLCKEISTRNKTIRVLKRLLLDQLEESGK